MGVALRPLFNPVEIDMSHLSRKVIAIDAYNLLYQFLTTIRQYDGTPLMDSESRITSHLSGLFYRTMNLLKSGIKPCFVFDGKPPSFKKQTISSRINARELAKKEYETALEKGDFDTAKTKAMQSTYLTKDMVEESKELIRHMGLPIIQAPSEGEAQAAYMCQKGDVFASVSQDYDSLLFGASRLIRNLSISGRRKLPHRNIYTQVSPEEIILKDELNRLGLFREQLVMIGILVGTDYNPKGVFGLGPKKAYKLVKEKKTFDEVFSSVDWKFDISPKEIFDFFMNPPAMRDYSLKWGAPDASKIIELLCDAHGFSRTRVENALGRLLKVRKQEGQLSLDDFA